MITTKIRPKSYRNATKDLISRVVGLALVLAA